MEGAGKEPRNVHEELRAKVLEVGAALGLHAVAEYWLGDHGYDVALFRPGKLFPIAVVEIGVGGDLSKDLASLEYASSRHNLIPIYVVGSEEDARRVEDKIQSDFRKIKDEIILLKADELEDLRRTLMSEAIKKAMRTLLCSH